MDSLALDNAEGLGVKAVGDGGLIIVAGTGKGLVANHGDLCRIEDAVLKGQTGIIRCPSHEATVVVG